MFRKLALAAAAATMVAAPVAAQSAPVDRAAAPTEEESELGGSNLMRALIIILIGVAGMGFLLLTDNDDSPASP